MDENISRRRLLPAGAALAASTAVLATPLGAEAATAATARAGDRAPNAKPTVVLVHGGYADSSCWNDVIAKLHGSIKKVLGMPVELEIQERGTFIKRMNAGEVPFFPWGWTADYPDAMYFLSQVWYGPSPYNRARWKNAEYDQLIDRAQGTADAQARYKLYHSA